LSIRATSHPGAGHQLLAQPNRVVEGADDVPPLQRRVQRQPAGPDAGRHHQPVVAKRAAVTERQDVPGQIDAGDHLAQPPADVTDGSLVPEREHRMVDAAGQALLRQRRPVVRQVYLVADDDDLAREAGGAQLFGRPQPAQTGAGHHDPLRH
jgi:hypothetical protein